MLGARPRPRSLILLLALLLSVAISTSPHYSAHASRSAVSASVVGDDDADHFDPADLSDFEAPRHAHRGWVDSDSDDEDDDDQDYEDGASLSGRLPSESSDDSFLAVIARWVDRNSYSLLIMSGVAVVGNLVFFVFAMGYLLKEDHVVVRALKFRKQPSSVVWRTITDVEAYPGWRANVTSCKILSAKSDSKKSLLGFTHEEKYRFPTSPAKFVVTEEDSGKLLVRKTHPEYTPTQYAQPMILHGAPVPANINQDFKDKVKQEQKKKDEEEKSDKGGVKAVQKTPTPGVPLDLPPAPLFYPPDVPMFTQTWTFELEDIPSGGCVLYVTYQGTVRSRFLRFFGSLLGYDWQVEMFLGNLASFLGENVPTRKPQQGKLVLDD